MQRIHRIPGKAADVLDRHHIKQSGFRILQKPLEFLPLFQGCSADALIRVHAEQFVTVPPGVFSEKFFLMIQTVKLFLFIRGDTAIGGNFHLQSASVCLPGAFWLSRNEH